jgi:hypothetical protein
MIKNILRLSNLVYLGTVVATAYQNDSSLFSWHPFFMAFFWVIIGEGVVQMKQKKTYAHKWLMLLASLSGLIGAAIMYQVKETKGSLHFQTTHGMYGGIICSLAFSQAVGAWMSLKTIQMKAIWKIHATFGYILVGSLWYISWLHLGDTNGWFMNNKIVKESVLLMSLGRSSFIISAILTLLYGKAKK